jgi:hypothetical protein
MTLINVKHTQTIVLRIVITSNVFLFDHSSTRWKFRVITSRMEPHLVNLFDSDFCHNIYLDSEDASDKDLALMLRAELRTMKPRQAALNPWPDDKTIVTLVWKCSRQYTYAAALLRFIEYHPQQRLQLVLGEMTSSESGPFQKLDTLYLQILQTVTIEDRPYFLQALGAIILLRQPPNASFVTLFVCVLDHLSNSFWMARDLE